jgi:hypothetical protein
VGKLDRQGRLNAVVPGSLVHIVDQLSNRRFLVDTGASYSIFPHTSSAAPSGPRLRGAAGQLIPCWGEKTFDLSFQGRRFSWTFLLAAVSFPIIGVDFLRHFKLMVDPAANALVDKCSRESFATISSLTAAAAADSGPPPAAQPAALICHRSPQSPASTLSGSGAVAASTAGADSYAQLLAEYTDDIRHIAGEENIVADTLYRPPPSAVALPATAWQEGKPEFLPESPAAQASPRQGSHLSCSPSTTRPASRPESSSGLQMTLRPLLGGAPVEDRIRELCGKKSATY